MNKAQSTETRILVEDLGKTYYPSPPWMRAMVRSNIARKVVALDGISLKVGAGEVCAFVGPNGAGKTTTFRILVGLTTPTAGHASIMGLDTTRDAVAVRRVVGWMPGDDRSLLMRLTCTENLRFHGRLQGLKGDHLKRKIRESLDTVGLGRAANSTVFALSAGMRARLQLARALLHDPSVLILDEPTGSVDPVAAHELLGLITETVRERKLAALISSHRLEEIEALHSRVILLDKGNTLFDGDLDDLHSRWDRRRVDIEFGSAAAADKARHLFSAGTHAATAELHDSTLIFTLDPAAELGAILADLEPLLAHITHVEEKRRPLRDLLADMYKNETGGTK